MSVEIAQRRLLEALAAMANDQTPYPGPSTLLPYLAAHVEESRKLAESAGLGDLAAMYAALIELMGAVWDDHHETDRSGVNG